MRLKGLYKITKKKYKARRLTIHRLISNSGTTESYRSFATCFFFL